MIGLAISVVLLVQTNAGVMSVVKDLTPEQCKAMAQHLSDDSGSGRRRKMRECYARLPKNATAEQGWACMAGVPWLMEGQSEKEADGPADPKLLECVQ